MSVQWSDCFRYIVGWTDNDDDEFDELMWDAWLSASLTESESRAESLHRSNLGRTFIVYDNVEGCVMSVTGGRDR